MPKIDLSGTVRDVTVDQIDIVRAKSGADTFDAFLEVHRPGATSQTGHVLLPYESYGMLGADHTLRCAAIRTALVDQLLKQWPEQRFTFTLQTTDDAPTLIPHPTGAVW